MRRSNPGDLGTVVPACRQIERTDRQSRIRDITSENWAWLCGDGRLRETGDCVLATTSKVLSRSSSQLGCSFSVLNNPASSTTAHVIGPRLRGSRHTDPVRVQARSARATGLRIVRQYFGSADVGLSILKFLRRATLAGRGVRLRQ
jgi:hypothetical protein